MMRESAVSKGDRSPAEATKREVVLTRAIVMAAEWLGITSPNLAKIIGVSPSTISRMKSGSYQIKETDKSFELGALFVRVYRSLFAIVGGDQKTARDWLKIENTALKGKPLDMMKTIRGLYEVCGYLDARRSVV